MLYARFPQKILKFWHFGEPLSCCHSPTRMQNSIEVQEQDKSF